MSTTLRTLLRVISNLPRTSRSATSRATRAILLSSEQQLEERCLLSGFTVTNTQDDGKAGSLRWAINRVNSGNGKKVETINFDIKGTGPFTIAPSSLLPTIINPVFIDGYSQPGAKPNTQGGGDNAVIMIQLSGTGAGFASGLEISASGSTVRGLAINQFAKEGIRLFSGGNDFVDGKFVV
jgi:hypothetical protein